MNREEQINRAVKPWIVLKHPKDDMPVWIRGLVEVRDVESVKRGKMYVIERKRLENYYLDI